MTSLEGLLGMRVSEEGKGFMFIIFPIIFGGKDYNESVMRHSGQRA